MKKFGLSAIIFFILAGTALYAEEQEIAAQKAPVVAKRTSEEEKIITESRKRVAEKRLDLNGTSWGVVYTVSSEPKMKNQKDTFVFQDNQFKSDLLAKRGFTSTNYTITVPPSETSEIGVWETMQTGKEGQIFIRGEWAKDQMSGRITEQLEGGKKVVEHSFTTRGREAIAPMTEKENKPTKNIDLPKIEGKPAPTGTALVSKEAEAEVTAFEPGTTQEVKKTH